MPQKISPAATTGFTDAASYDQHRPSYPLSAVQHLLASIQIAGEHGARVIDFAAGTGKFTTLLAQRDEGYNVIAVEPHEGMRAELARKGLRGVQVVAGSAAEMRGVADGEADAVIAAQAFHWFSNDAALREIYRVLKPGGSFGMIWNVEDYNQPQSWTPSTAWEDRLKALTHTFHDGQPRFRHEQWKEVFDRQGLFNPLFSLPVGERSVRTTAWLKPDALWDRYATLSQIAVLGGEQKEESVRKELFEALQDDSVERNNKGEVAVHLVTFSAWTLKV